MDEWKRELRKQGPVPSSVGQRSVTPSRKEGLDLSDVKNLISQSIKESSGKVSATGKIEVELAPIARFPWEVRFVTNSSGVGVIRVYKGIIVDTSGGAYETRNAHVKYRSGRSTTPIKLQGDNVSSPGDYDWISTVDQNDPMAVPPEGNGTQISWPPQFIGGSTTSAIASSKRDPEPIDGGIPFETRGVNIGKQGYGATGADGMPWFDFAYVPGTPVYLACKPNSLGQNEFGVFYGSTGLDTESGWYVRIAHVTSSSLIHQYFRSDVVIGPSGSTGTTDHPFKVTCVVESGAVMANVSDGHVNNVTLVDPINDWQSLGSSTQQQKIYLIVHRTGTTYPSSIEWAVFGPSANPVNDEDKAHILLATVDVVAGTGGSDPTFTINQMAMSAYNTIRIKYGPGASDVTYMFNRV